MWFSMAVTSAVFVGISTILSKIGIRTADAYRVNAINNTVLLAAFGAAAFFGGGFSQIGEMGSFSWISVIASGCVLSVSWMFYYRGLKRGNVSVFLAIQSLSVVISMILCRIVLGEKITGSMSAGAGMILAGAYLMTGKDKSGKPEKWMIFSFISAVLSAVSFVIVKMDTAPIDTNVTSFFRYSIVVVILWMVSLQKSKDGKNDRRSNLFIFLGALSSAAAHVLVYKALFFGKAAVVLTIYRMGMVISVILAGVILKEKMTKRGWTGFALLTAGVVLFALGR